MRALDLFCGGGGASKGLANAGFEVYGVDVKNQKEYPFPERFKQSDVFAFNIDFIRQFDLVWASPPCQAYCIGTLKYRNKGKEYPDLVDPTRQLLLSAGVPFVMENVVGAPLRKDLMLCGEWFGLRVIRHRIFELHGFGASQPEHKKHKLSIQDGSAIGVYGSNGTMAFIGKRKSGWGKTAEQQRKSYYACVAGHGGDGYSSRLHDWQQAMGIDWINTKTTLTQCVPPAYSEYIAREFLNPRQKTIDAFAPLPLTQTIL